MNLEAIEFILAIQKQEDPPEKPIVDELLSVVEQSDQEEK